MVSHKGNTTCVVERFIMHFEQAHIIRGHKHSATKAQSLAFDGGIYVVYLLTCIRSVEKGMHTYGIDVGYGLHYISARLRAL